MAESALVGLRTATACGACGKKLAADLKHSATFCRECGCCLLALPSVHAGTGALQPFVPPRVEKDAAWLSLRGADIEASKATLTASRLLFVPFREWSPDLSRTRVVHDARALLAPAADLLPAGFLAPVAPAGDDRRGLAIAETSHKGRLADPEGALALIRQGEVVDPMLPPPARAPEGAEPGATPRLLYYPFWFLTYRIDWTERRGVVDAVTGEPVGPSSAPRRWAPAAIAAAAGLAVFLLLFLALKPLEMPVVGGIVAAAGSWAAATVSLDRLIRRERAR